MRTRIGRWEIELHQRAIYITREPDPDCTNCTGSRGGWQPQSTGADWGECHCLDQLRTWRLPLWRRNPSYYPEAPF
ncbi:MULTISPECIES: hypothetical protein [Streptomyces]|uniref:hypothetical protein n=1 Tax=Streptomyces TaxID=1883 RepID=UPI000F786B97|nr:hypothetical protein [Streptomyces sp. WAC05858]RSS39458.1 hypothetical protein EF902_27615 [Streptomyces sp. WAC05858]WTA79277.1 hypothetical protein OG751_04390 [Streptomyces antimycoticus]